MGPLSLLAAPAALSTACDDLKEKLNAVRISDLSPEIDARLIILERAMANVNHGQGVGFDVKGIVVDKKMLTLMAVKLYAAGSATYDTYVSFIPALQTTIPEDFPLRPETVDWLDRNDRAFGSRHT